jgi:CubicO group peptidase (beta-lactamase class C family)
MSVERKPASIAELRLFTGVPQYENFAQLKNLLNVREMKASRHAFLFAEGPSLALPKSYDFEGETKDLNAFLAETHSSALIVIKDGAIQAEHYWLTGGRDVQWPSMSVAKSFISALVGIAVQEGFIKSVEDPMDRYVPSLSGSVYEGVRIKDVLQMSSGARWTEDYNDPSSEIFRLTVAMAPGGSLDAFVPTMVRESEPGTVCRYNSAETQALGMLLVGATGRSISDYMHEKLCEPLGMEQPSYWLLDSRSREMAFAGLNMTARDFAKLGELYRNGGMWRDRQVVPAEWVNASTKPDAPHLAPGKTMVADRVTSLGYGYQWWIPGGHRGEFSAIGVYNQFVYVDPSRGAVIVKLSANPAYGTSKTEKTNKEGETIEALRAIVRQFD